MNRTAHVWITLVSALSTAAPALAQNSTTPPAPPAPPATKPEAGKSEASKPDATKPEARKPAPVPGLDDLLNLPSTKKPAPADAPADGAQDALPPEPPVGEPGDAAPDELERKLTEQEIADRFRDAVRQMGESADRIASSNDVGLVTQRLQEEILKKLDLIVKQSENNSSSSSSSSSSSQSQQSDPGRQNQQQRGQQQQQQQQNAQAGQGENQGEAMPPPGQDPQFKGRLDTARAAWGSLPERVRESLLQGSSDYFSSLYEAMTESYYRKLAEEGQGQ
jgi:hypothetical protein